MSTDDKYFPGYHPIEVAAVQHTLQMLRFMPEDQAKLKPTIRIDTYKVTGESDYILPTQVMIFVEDGQELAAVFYHPDHAPYFFANWGEMLCELEAKRVCFERVDREWDSEDLQALLKYSPIMRRRLLEY